MPHIVIEYADEPHIAKRINVLLDAVVAFIEQSPMIELSNLKLRAHAFTQYRVEGRADPFVHTSIALMQGHDLSNREKLVSDIFELVSSQFEDVRQVTVELREMETATYRRRKRIQ